MTITIFSKHSYFNRKIVARDTLTEYQEAFKQLGLSFYNIDFKIQNGIKTEQIINYDYNPHEDYFDERADYYDGTKSSGYLVVSDAIGAVQSRWWVIDSTLVRQGQSKLVLLRDVIADNLQTIINSPAFIEKGWINTINDTAIFNNENILFNQIKQNELLLKDKSNCGWIVSYLSKDFGKNKDTEEYQDVTIKLPKQVVNTTGSYATTADYSWSQYTASNPLLGAYETFNVEMYGYSSDNAFIYSWDRYGSPSTPKPHDNYAVNAVMSKVGVLVNTNGGAVGLEQKSSLVNLGKIYQHTKENWVSDSYAYTDAKPSLATELLGQDGRIIRINGVAKKVTVNSKLVTKTIPIQATSPYGQRIWNVGVKSEQFYTDRVYVNLRQTLTFTVNSYWVSLETIDEPEYTFIIPATRQHTQNVPYDILAIPYNELTVDTEANASSANLSLIVSTALQTNIAKEYLYDIQIVPYCPLVDTYLNNGVLCSLLVNTETLVNYTKVQIPDSDAWTMVFYPSEFEFTKVLDYSIELSEDPLEYKVSNECDTYRLCSPNYNGQFEFSAAKNGGVSAFNIAFTYKPYSPYIKVAPMFNRLYGSAFKDARGLICGGDFSVSQTNEAWTSYEVQNKNYQTIFDRQIQNMEVNNSVQRIKEIVNASVGALTGTATGVTGGSFIGSAAAAGGGPVGAAIGGIIGGLGSVAGGIADIALNEQLRSESMSYSKDMFSYNLQNIRALPYSLTKVGTQNTDFKVFPFLEYYTCTEIEKEALRDKCKWNGMTIGRIGTISSFIGPDQEIGTFIQAQLIRSDISEHSIFNNLINTELQKGVYV